MNIITVQTKSLVANTPFETLRDLAFHIKLPVHERWSSASAACYIFVLELRDAETGKGAQRKTFFCALTL